MSAHRWIWVVVGAGLVGAAAFAWIGHKTRTGNDPGEVGSRAFQDVAEKAGIEFRMGFLAAEQGEQFKINLYDHGCGVAIGDFNGDGRDDIYFLNQLGANALYRNEGDLRFTEVTQESGKVGLADRICVGGAFADYDNDGDQDL